MKPVHQVLFAAGLLVLGTITWLILTRPKPQAGWLSVESPARVAPGETITLRVTLTDPDEALQLCADLHGWTARKKALGAVSHAGAQRVERPAEPMDFHLPVPATAGLTAVRAVIYLSPTGRWGDYVRVVLSAEIPVDVPSGSAASGKLQPLRVHDHAADPAIPRTESLVLRNVIAGLWVGVALGLTWRRKTYQLATGRPIGGSLRLRHGLLVAACLSMALAEILQFETQIGDLARHFALRHDFYEERLLPQQIAVLLTVVGLAALAVIVILRARNRRLVLGLLIYAALSLTAALSLHDADALLYTTTLGLPVEQLAKLMAVALAIWGLRRHDQSSTAA